MSLTAKVYPQFQQKALSKGVDLTSDAVKVALFSAYTYAATHATLAHVKGAGTEVSGTGYTAGGVALGSVTLATSGDVTTFDAADPSWSDSTITASYAVFYDSSGGTDATDDVIAYWDFGAPYSSSAGTFTLALNASGVLTATSS